jgi:hypothetical protein
MINNKDIIRLRDECDEWAENHLQCKGEYHPDFHSVSDERFAELVASAEREACLKAVEQAIEHQIIHYPEGYSINANKLGEIFKHQHERCVKAIQARGQT